MIRKKTTLKCKSGGVQNGNGAGHPRALIDLCAYREKRNFNNIGTTWDPKYSGWSNPSRPRDYAIFLRPIRHGS
jgi:hypothetical protein